MFLGSWGFRSAYFSIYPHISIFWPQLGYKALWLSIQSRWISIKCVNVYLKSSLLASVLRQLEVDTSFNYNTLKSNFFFRYNFYLVVTVQTLLALVKFFGISSLALFSRNWILEVVSKNFRWKLFLFIVTWEAMLIPGGSTLNCNSILIFTAISMTKAVFRPPQMPLLWARVSSHWKN